jgi:hypothetical protein
MLTDMNEWGEIGELFLVNNNHGQGNPSSIKQEFTNVFCILGLSMPPDVADHKAINDFFHVLIDTTGLNEMKPILVAGPNQLTQYE